LGSFYIYLFPCCFLLLGIIQGLLWQNKRIGDIPFVVWIIAFAMLSCFLVHQWISPLFNQIGISLSDLIMFLGVLLIHGFLAWIGFRLTYYGEK